MTTEKNAVQHPDHYTWHPSGVECRKIVEEFPYHIASAMAYLWRSDHKGEFEQDIRKAMTHLRFELERRGIKP